MIYSLKVGRAIGDGRETVSPSPIVDRRKPEHVCDSLHLDKYHVA
jgi:hypothetical protein